MLSEIDSSTAVQEMVVDGADAGTQLSGPALIVEGVRRANTLAENELLDELRNYAILLRFFANSTTILIPTSSEDDVSGLVRLSLLFSSSSSPTFLDQAQAMHVLAIERINWCERVMELSHVPSYLGAYLRDIVPVDEANIRIVLDIVAEATERVRSALNYSRVFYGMNYQILQ